MLTSQKTSLTIKHIRYIFHIKHGMLIGVTYIHFRKYLSSPIIKKRRTENAVDSVFVYTPERVALKNTQQLLMSC